MYVLTRSGFVSIRRLLNSTRLSVRARREEHLRGFFGDAVSLVEDRIQYTPRLDYDWRVEAFPEEVLIGLNHQAGMIDYDNFKDAAAAVDPELGEVYASVWGDLCSFIE